MFDAMNPEFRVFLDAPRWFCRPRNTDWRYVRFNVSRLGDWDERVRVWLQDSPQVSARANGRYISDRIKTRLGVSAAHPYRGGLSQAELARSRSNVVFSHREYPANSRIPVIWQNSILDPRMVLARYGDRVDVVAERSAKERWFEASAVSLVSTEAEVERLAGWYPSIAGRFFWAPFFMPELKVAPDEILAKHLCPESVHLLFVGNEARRKGLDIFLDAFAGLAPAIRQQAKVTIVSSFADGPVAVPDTPQFEVHQGLPHDQVIDHMRRSHALIHPARFESYGLVLVEAMAMGCVPLGPDWEVQREILAYGNAGLPCTPDVSSVRQALESLIADHDGRSRLARQGLEHARRTFSPKVVAERYVGAMQRALAT